MIMSRFIVLKTGAKEIDRALHGQWWQETWETETGKAEKSMGDAKARFHAPSVTGMGIWSWLCVFVGFFKQIRCLLLKVIFQN